MMIQAHTDHQHIYSNTEYNDTYTIQALDITEHNITNYY